MCVFNRNRWSRTKNGLNSEVKRAAATNDVSLEKEKTYWSLIVITLILNPRSVSSRSIYSPYVEHRANTISVIFLVEKCFPENSYSFVIADFKRFLLFLIFSHSNERNGDSCTILFLSPFLLLSCLSFSFFLFLRFRKTFI